MIKVRLEVHGEWAGSVDGRLYWRPAVTGTLNQTGKDDYDASEFSSRDEAYAFYEQFILPELPETEPCGKDPVFRIVRLDSSNRYEKL